MSSFKSSPSLATIQEHRIALPVGAYSPIGSQQDYKELPIHWQEQIYFYDKAGTAFLYTYWEHSNLVTGPLYHPFLGSPFSHTSTWADWEEKACSKWLYNRGIAFDQRVWVLSNFSDTATQMTWKLVIKLRENLFQGDDVVVFDDSLQWCLFYYHEDTLFWASSS